MITILTGVIISLVISVMGPDTSNQQRVIGQNSLQNDDQSGEIKDIAAPNEALGGGFKKHRE